MCRPGGPGPPSRLPNYTNRSVSRSALYEPEQEPSDDDVYMPAFEFEEVEVEQSTKAHVAPVTASGIHGIQSQDVPQEVQPGAKDAQTELVASPSTPEEFAFRLFAEQAADVKILLREDADDEIIVNERPSGYYFLQYLDEQKAQFATAAVDFSQAEFGVADYSALRRAILGQCAPAFSDSTRISERAWTDHHMHELWRHNRSFRVLDATAHNARVEADQKRKRHRREGKKKRAVKVACRERRQKREKEAKRIEKDARKRHYASTAWQGPKKPKLSKASKPSKPSKPVVSKPKYRTE